MAASLLPFRQVSHDGLDGYPHGGWVSGVAGTVKVQKKDRPAHDSGINLEPPDQHVTD